MRRIIAICIGAVGWFAILSQFVIMLENRTTEIPEMIARFFSYFTILTNALVALFFTTQGFGVNRHVTAIAGRPGTLTAITVYITVVGLVYQIALRHLWRPTGLQMIVDELLHTILPAMTIFYWAFYGNKSKLEFTIVPKILIYPLCYLGFVLFRGALSGFYPYPFINVSELGWPQTGVNILVLTAVFAVLSLLFVGVNQRISRSISS